MRNLFSPARSPQATSHALARPLAALGLLLATAGAAQAQTTTNFTYTAPGSAQSYTVPAGITKLNVVATGGGGGGNRGNNKGGLGAVVSATVTVVPGEMLTVVVGGRGTDSNNNGSNPAGGAGGYNGGGNGSYTGGGGGGATDLRRAVANGSTGDYFTSRNALLVAGGGGGGDTFGSSGGGSGGTPTGGNGGSGQGGPAGQGATTTALGGGYLGSNGTGGNGNPNNFNAAGGGGYYGGGGGGGAAGSFTNGVNGGGGGSSYVLPTGSSNVSYSLTGALADGALAITTVPTPTNNALAFDASDDYVAVNAQAGVSNLTTTGYTLEAWVNVNSVGTVVNSVIRKDGDYNLYIYNGFARTQIWTGSALQECPATTALVAGRWNHIAGTWNGSVLKVYLNGVDVTGTTGTATNNASSQLWLGRSQTYNEPLNGRLDEVRIYNTPLTQAQIQADMFSTAPAVPASLKAYYNFDQGTAGGNNAGLTNLPDQSGNGNTGTLTNFALTGTSSNWVRSFPTITGINPTSGQVSSSVTVTGTNLLDATSFAFNGTAVSPFTTPSSDLTATVTVPSGATTGPVSVASATLTTYNGPVFTVAATTAVTWTGATSTNWATASNWNPAVVPTTSIDVTIPAAPANQPVVPGSQNQASRNITVAAGARLTLAANANLAVGDINSSPTASLTLGSGSTFAQGAGSEIYLTGNFTNNGATFALDPASEIGFGLTAGNTHLLNGTAGLTLPNLTVGEQGTNDGLTIQVPVSVRRTLQVFNSGTVSAGTGGSILLLSDASGTALIVNTNGGVVSGPVTVQRYIDPSLNPSTTANPGGKGYRHYSAPVSNSTVADLATTGFTPVLTQSYNTSATPGTTTPFPNVFAYDQSRLVSAANSNYSDFDKGFVVPAAASTALTPGLGYAVNIAGTELVDFVGTPNNGNLTLSLSRNSGATAAAAGWQLVGNPYPAPLDYSLVTPADRQNLDAAVYVVQSTGQYAGQYRSYVNGNSTSGTNNPLLATGQGFFVRVSSGQTSGSLTFRNAQRVTSYSQQSAFNRTSADARPSVRLELAGAGLADGFVAYAEAGATPGFDPAYDAAKLPNPTGLNLSSATAADNLAIDGRAVFTAATTLPLNVGVPAAGRYTLTATTLANLPAGLAPALRDAATGQLTPLTPGTAYSFSVSASEATALLTGRFTLQFSGAGPLATATALAASEVSVYPNPAQGRFMVLVPAVAGATAVQAELLNTLGQVVRRQSAALPAAGATLSVEAAGLAAGVYTLRLTAGASTLAKRVVLQ